ncbi:MAG: aminotransferase class I/II-fold pyridoxal phosphate-dependent enzyme [Gammaproteobacteria bacterium]|nr:aminotransferase class I/II-fold pyridoxal phosphate-dependent enzyme [Gammaproteobacteria bacterium]
MNESATPTFLELAAPGIAGLEPYQPGKPLEALAREYGVRDAVKLASNENPLGPSPRALEAARAALRQVSRYPEGGGEQLKAALGHRHGVEPRCITLGNGSNDVLELLARVFLTPDHAAVLSEHAFAVYPIVTQATGAEARVASAQGPDAAMPNGHDLEAMAARVTDRTRVVFVANPNNPTGTWLDAGALEAFVAALPSHAIAVIDEAYFEYVETPGYPDAVKWLERYPNLVVTRTFSKVYGLAGLRVGYAVSHPEVADLMNRVRQPFNVNAVGQAAALEALDDREHLRKKGSVPFLLLRRGGRKGKRVLTPFASVGFGEERGKGY